MSSSNRFQLIDPYEPPQMLEMFKQCVKDFRNLETTESKIVEMVTNYNDRRPKLIIKMSILYLQWVHSVKKNFCEYKNHLIDGKRCRELTRILFINCRSNNTDDTDTKKPMSHCQGYRKYYDITKTIQHIVNSVMEDEDQFFYDIITNEFADTNELVDELLKNTDFMMKASLKAVFDKPRLKIIDFNDDNNVIDDNVDNDDDVADQDKYLLNYQNMYPFQGLKVLNKVTNYFESLHGKIFLQGSSSLGSFEGVDGMWTTSVVIQIASVLNDVFRNVTHDIHGIDFGHGSALTIFVLLESLNSSKFNMIGLEVCSLYIIYYFHSVD